MAFTTVQINFSVVDPRGWVSGVQITRELDKTQDLQRQVVAEASDWVERRKRVHGQCLDLAGILSVFFEAGGFWYARSHDRMDWGLI